MEKKEIILNDVFDAGIWAKEFMRIWGDKLKDLDLDLMRGWFANAIMAGYDHAKRKQILQYKSEIRQAMARGYCTERNSKKVLDPDLIEDMAAEILKLEAPLPPAEVREKFRDILTDFHDNIIDVMDSSEDTYHERIDEAEEKALAQLLALYPQGKVDEESIIIYNSCSYFIWVF